MILSITLISIIFVFYIKSKNISLKITLLVSLFFHSFLFLNMIPRKINKTKDSFNKNEYSKVNKIPSDYKEDQSTIQIQNIDFNILNQILNKNQTISKENTQVFTKNLKQDIPKQISNPRQNPDPDIHHNHSHSKETFQDIPKKDISHLNNLDSIHFDHQKKSQNIENKEYKKSISTLNENSTDNKSIPNWIMKKNLNQLSNFHWNHIEEPNLISTKNKTKKWEKFQLDFNIQKSIDQNSSQINFSNLQNYIYKKWFVSNLKKIAEKWFYQNIPLNSIIIGSIRDIKYPIEIEFEINPEGYVYNFQFLKKETLNVYNKAITNVLDNFQFTKIPNGINVKNINIKFYLTKKIDELTKNTIQITGLVHLEGFISFDE